MTLARSFVPLTLLISGCLVSVTCTADVVEPPEGIEFVATRLDYRALAPELCLAQLGYVRASVSDSSSRQRCDE